MKTVFKTKAFCFKSTGPSPSIKPLDHLRELFIGQPSDRFHWTNLRYNLLDNPPNIEPLDHLREPLIGQPSDRVHWTNLQYNLLDNPPNHCHRTTLRISNHWTISENLLLDNPLIGFIGQTSNIIYWTTLQYWTNLRYYLLDKLPNIHFIHALTLDLRDVPVHMR